jgi:hypothetical protein
MAGASRWLWRRGVLAFFRHIPIDDVMAFADRWIALRPKYVIDRHEAQCAAAAGLDRPRP